MLLINQNAELLLVYDYRQITASFQFEAVNSQWLAICCYSGIPILSTGSLNLIWPKYTQENFVRVLGKVLQDRVKIVSPQRGT